MKKKNLLFIMTDHQRYDTINMVQCGREVTPHLNRLARSGILCERAYTTCPLCVPARTALAAGIYPTESGIVYNDWDNRTAKPMTPIHDILKQNGYEVGHIGVDHIRVLPALKNRNYDCYVSQEEYEDLAAGKGYILKERSDITYVQEACDEAISSQGYSGVRVSEWPYPLDEFKDCYFMGQALEFLKQWKGDRPFALFVYLWAPHPPLKVPKPYGDLYSPEDLVLPSNISVPAAREPESRRKSAAAQLAEGVEQEQWRRVWAASLGLTSLADDIIGKLMEEVEQMGEKDHTAVIFTSDHGDNLGQHSMYQKMEMYEECIHIPLIMSLPGQGPARVKDLVSHLDVVPTICQFLGLACDGLEGIPIPGLCSGKQAQSREAVFSQYSGTYGYGFIRRAVITKSGEKYVFDETGMEEYYRLPEDPCEMNNLAGEVSCRDRVRALHEQCRTYHQIHGDYFNWSEAEKRGAERGVV